MRRPAGDTSQPPNVLALSRGDGEAGDVGCSAMLGDAPPTSSHVRPKSQLDRRSRYVICPRTVDSLESRIASWLAGLDHVGCRADVAVATATVAASVAALARPRIEMFHSGSSFRQNRQLRTNRRRTMLG